MEVAFNLKVWQGRQSLERFTGVAYGREKRFLSLPILRREEEESQRREKRREEKRKKRREERRREKKRREI